MFCRKVLYIISQKTCNFKNLRHLSKSTSYFSEQKETKKSPYCFTEDEKQLKETGDELYIT